MSTFNVFMHNKVQLFVPTLARHQTDLEADGVYYMKRLSTLPDGTSMAHMSVPVQGRVYELVGPASTLTSTTDFVAWSAELNECPQAHALTYYDTIDEWISEYETQKSDSTDDIATYANDHLDIGCFRCTQRAE